MSRIQQPSNQIKLTNVSLVRLKKGGKRFEIACYKNKVLEWREGIETDLDNVLQIPNVFLNVSRGQTAPQQDLEKAFGKGKKLDDIILEILNKGEIQVGDKERAQQLERMHNEVVAFVASRLVDPRTKHVYTPTIIAKALDVLSQNAHANPDDGGSGGGAKKAAKAGNKEGKQSDANTPTSEADAGGGAKPRKKDVPTWTGVVLNKSAKSQALDAMKALIAAQPIPVMRARMRLRVTCPSKLLKQTIKDKAAAAATKDQEAGASEQAPPQATTVKDKILSYIEHVETQEMRGNEWEAVGFVEPGAFKVLSDFIGAETKGQGRVEVLDMAVTHEDEH